MGEWNDFGAGERAMDADLIGRLAALESVMRGLSCEVIDSKVDGLFLHVRRETGMPLTPTQAAAVRQAVAGNIGRSEP
jgi:hypothetical protein